MNPLSGQESIMTRAKFPMLRSCLALLILPLLTLSGCEKQEAVKFGAVLPLTGSSAIYGNEIAKGIELAFEELKAAPGAAEMELEIVDSQSDPEKGKAALEALYESGARAAIGGVTTPEALAQVEVAERMNRVLLSPSASARELTGISLYFYRVWPSDNREGSKMAQYAAQNLNLKTTVILASDTLFSEGIRSVFRSSFEQNGGEILEQVNYPANTDDLEALGDLVMGLKPEGVYIADYADGIVQMIQLLKDKGYTGKILTVSAFASPQAIANAGSAAEGVFVTQPQFDPEGTDNPVTRAFVDAFRAKYSETPGNYAAHGFDAMKVLVQALEDGGDRGHSFWKGMRSVNDLPGATGPLQFDDKGDVTKYPRVYFIIEGKVVDHISYLETEKERIMEELRKARDRMRDRASS